MSKLARFPSLHLGVGMAVILPTLVAIPFALRMFHQHKLLNIIPSEIIESRPEWADQNYINTPYKSRSMNIERIRSFSFVDVLNMHRAATNFVCPLVGSFTFSFLYLQMKYRLRILTPLERTTFSFVGALGMMSVTYIALLLHGYQWRDTTQRRDLKYELHHRIGLWLSEERDPEWSKRIRFNEELGILEPAQKSHFRK